MIDMPSGLACTCPPIGLNVFVVASLARRLAEWGEAQPALGPLATAILAGVVVFGRALTDGPWPEAVRVTSLAVCSGFTYAALRWRTASIWPVLLANVAFTFSVDIAALGTISYRILMLLGTLGFVAYGIFLLRNREARADGGLTPEPKPSRVK